MILLSDPVNVLEGTAPHAVPKQSSAALLDRYIPIQAAGVGSTASVMLAYDSVTHKSVALKAVRKSKMSKRKILQEISVQAAVSQHPFIATLHDAVETADTFTLVEEYMPNGDLFDVIKPDLGMPEAQAMRYAKEIISAIEYMHMCNTVHRDIKPENVCLSAEDTCRLIDFGHAAFSQDCRQDDYIGTVPYMAFELLLSENRPCIDYRQTDMWAFGATVFVMCTGKFPWREATLGDKEFACYAAGGSGPCHRARWASFSPALNMLLRNTMCIDTHKRWSATEARVFIEQHWGSSNASTSSLITVDLDNSCRCSPIPSEALGVMSPPAEHQSCHVSCSAGSSHAHGSLHVPFHQPTFLHSNNSSHSSGIYSRSAHDVMVTPAVSPVMDYEPRPSASMPIKILSSARNSHTGSHHGSQSSHHSHHRGFHWAFWRPANAAH